MTKKISTKFATREDIYNLAMDLPVEESKAFLGDLTPAKVAGLMTPEELAIMKAQVGWVRWRDSAIQDKLAGLQAELDQAKATQEQAQKDHDNAVRKAAAAIAAMKETKAAIVAISARLVALGDLDDAIRTEIAQAKEHADALLQAKVASVRRIEAAEEERHLNRIIYLRGNKNG